jgi:hypothetical protein
MRLNDYIRNWILMMSNRDTPTNSAVVMTWEGYSPTMAVDYQVPDFSGVAGWNNAWGLQAGTGFAIDVIALMNGWVLGGGSGQPPQAEGTITTSAMRLEAINP